ncbi:MAG: hypothetical protein QOH97_1263 [Actinoplanes sp.]|nr:hypothetical protein [Actinoplanes sp.]
MHKVRDMDMLTREWDLIELPGGEILTCVGSFRGTRTRGRVTYVPDDDGAVEIFGRRYRKISYEISGSIDKTKQVLALPGECHYVVPVREIARHHPTIPLASEQPEIADLVSALSAMEIPLHVGGSRAINASRIDSDYDLVIYGKSNIERAAKTITALPAYHQDPHFGLDFVRAKYRHFTRLTRKDLELLVADRWRHFRFHGIAMSLDVADPDLPSDRWTAGQARLFDVAHVRGVVLDGSQCYLSPKIIDVQTDTGIIRAFTWLNLYTGALRTGDQIAVYGRWMVMHGHQFLLVLDSTHAIRVVARPSTNPV